MATAKKPEVRKLMARKKSEEAPVKTDGWMSTFSDLMNLLLCFFVLLFSMSTVDAEKFQEVIASFSSSYNVLSGGATGIGEGMLIASGASQLNQLSEYYSSMGLNNDGEDTDEVKDALLTLEQAEMHESEEMGEAIENMLSQAGVSEDVEVKVTQHYVCLNMKGALLFESASATLTADAIDVLSEVGNILKLYDDNTIEIEGHTDNIPINAGIFTSNNVLSDYRALAVFDYLVDTKGIDPTNLIHAGRGEYDPIASNDTAEGRTQNRRVEIKIYNSYSSYD